MSESSVSEGSDSTRSSSLVDVVLVVLVAVLPLLVIPGLHYAYQLPKLVVFFVAVGLILVAGFVALASGRPAVRLTVPDLLALALLAWLALATARSEWPAASFWGLPPRFEGWLAFLGYGVIYGAARTRSGRVLRLLGEVVSASMALVGLLALLEMAGWFHPLGSGVFGPRAVATMGNPVYVGALAAMTLPVTASLLLAAGGRTRRLLLAAALASETIALTLSASRAGWLAALAAALVVGGALLLRWHFGGADAAASRTLCRNLGLAAAAVAVGVGLSALVSPDAVSGTLGPASRPAGTATPTVTVPGTTSSDGVTTVPQAGAGRSSTETRLLLWRSTMSLVREQPLVGHGPETFLAEYPRVRSQRLLQLEDYGSYPDRPHDQYLYLAYAGGLPALALYIAFLVAVVWGAVRALQRRSVGQGALTLLGLLASVTAYEVQALLSFSLPMVTPLAALAAGALVTLSRPRPPRPRVSLEGTWSAAIGVCLLLLALPFFAESFRLAAADTLSTRAASHPWDATSLLARATRLAPRDPSYALGLGAAWRNAADGDPTLLARAESAYRRALADAPARPDVTLALSRLLRSERRTAEADAALRDLLRRDPFQPEALLTLARSDLEQGRPAEALRLLERRAAYATDSADGWYLLGRAREETGDRVGARGAYRRALELEPTRADAAEGLRRTDG